MSTIYGRPKTPFSFKTLGALAAIGRHAGVTRILGINFSGLLAWFLWRGIYWSNAADRGKSARRYRLGAGRSFH
jgi:NADH dehydrogenase FAD-containing subunit